MFSDTTFQDVQVKLQYESNQPQDLLISYNMLEWTVKELKGHILQQGQFYKLGLAPEFVDLVIEVGREGEGERGRKHMEEIILMDNHDLGFYYGDFERGHVMKMKRKRPSWLDDLAYFYRRTDEVLGSYKDVLLFLFLITSIVLVYNCDCFRWVDDLELWQ